MKRTNRKLSLGPGQPREGLRERYERKRAMILREKLENALDEINESVSSIYKEMSGFNAPGMKKAFYDSIVKGMNKHTNMFMINSAKRELEKYYDRDGE